MVEARPGGRPVPSDGSFGVESHPATHVSQALLSAPAPLRSGAGEDLCPPLQSRTVSRGHGKTK
eukprot:11527246-Alexandrium_andersonii.AAC.1